MRKTLISFIFSALLLCQGNTEVFAWGRYGHDAIAYIAECNLKPKTIRTISHYLDGRSIVYYSTWMDEVRTTPEFEYTTKWHVAYYDQNDKPYLGRNFNEDPAPDCLLQLEKLIEKMGCGRYKEYDDSTVTVAIKMIVHMVGDMHCPVHVKYPGVKSFKVVYQGKECKYHTLWDELLIESVHKWGYMEYGHQFNRLDKKQIKNITAGGPEDWGAEAARDCHVIYEWADAGDSLGKPFYMTARPLADSQIQKAGYRLAKVLNEVFGK